MTKKETEGLCAKCLKQKEIIVLVDKGEIDQSGNPPISATWVFTDQTLAKKTYKALKAGIADKVREMRDSSYKSEREDPRTCSGDESEPANG